MTTDFNPAEHPRGDGGKFATKDRHEAGQVDLRANQVAPMPADPKGYWLGETWTVTRVDGDIEQEVTYGVEAVCDGSLWNTDTRVQDKVSEFDDSFDLSSPWLGTDTFRVGQAVNNKAWGHLASWQDMAETTDHPVHPVVPGVQYQVIYKEHWNGTEVSMGQLATVDVPPTVATDGLDKALAMAEQEAQRHNWDAYRISRACLVTDKYTVDSEGFCTEHGWDCADMRMMMDNKDEDN